MDEKIKENFPLEPLLSVIGKIKTKFSKIAHHKTIVFGLLISRLVSSSESGVNAVGGIFPPEESEAG